LSQGRRWGCLYCTHPYPIRLWLHFIRFLGRPTFAQQFQLTEWGEEVILKSKVVVPEPEAGVSTLSPETAVRVLDGRLVVRQVRLVRRIGVFGLIRGRAEVRDPVGTEETDTDGDECERQQQRRRHKDTVGTTRINK